MLDVHFGDNLTIIQEWPDEQFDLIYIDPPFNTGRVQSRTRSKAIRDDYGHHVGFKGNKYRMIEMDTKRFNDQFDDYMAFLSPRLIEAYRLLSPRGSFFLHIDYREVHYAKILLDMVFGRQSFLNEIIWAYDYGGRSKKRWSAKHDNILFYVKDINDYTFRYEDMERIPYMAPGLVTKEKARRGKTPTDTWWHTIVSPNGQEKTGYPTQKPRGVLDRIVRVHSNPGDTVLDFFAGSGTTGESAIMNNRHAVLVDNNEEAMRVMESRFRSVRVNWHNWTPRPVVQQQHLL